MFGFLIVSVETVDSGCVGGESDCTQLCKYIHIFVKFGPRQYEKRDVS